VSSSSAERTRRFAIACILAWVLINAHLKVRFLDQAPDFLCNMIFEIRVVQLRERLSDGKTRALVAEAEEAGDMFVMIEIDPREGSGVIPAEWFAFMRPKGKPEKAVAGTLMPQFRNVKALSGVMPRDYAYDVFWAVFPMITDSGEPIFSDSDREVELAVSIYNKQGQVTWKIPESIYKTLRNTP
jgi:hypothetical protein